MKLISLPALASRALVHQRLQLIFPIGSPVRGYCTRDSASATVFVLLYVGAVEGSGIHLAPKQVYWMSDEQAELTSDAARREYAAASLKPRFQGRGKPWYEVGTREPIRDETLRHGLIPVGAVEVRGDITKNSPKGRYALAADFAHLFDPALEGAALDQAITAWRTARLNPAARARIALLRAAAASDEHGVEVTFPGGEGQRLSPGESSYISKAVIEDFSPRFLTQPAVVWLSESGNKVVARHDILAKSIGLRIDQTEGLPDIILADLGSQEVLLVFVEVVSTDGPINELRRTHLLKLAVDAGLAERHVAFVTAFMDREHSALRKTLPDLAWNSFVWIASEPDGLIALMASHDSHLKLRSILGAFARA